MRLLRDASVALISVVCIVLLVLVASGNLRIFAPPPSREHDVALYLLSTIVQSLGALIGIATAIILITFQLVRRPGHSRLLQEFYWNSLSIGALLLLVLSSILPIVILASLGKHLPKNVTSSRWIDICLILFCYSLLLLVPLLLQQLENAYPQFVARRLTRGIRTKTIRRYGLVSVRSDDRYRLGCSLNMWNSRHGVVDPLAAYHEVVMQAVESRDRVLLSLVTRLLMQRICLEYGLFYPVDAHQEETKPALAVRVAERVLRLKLWAIPPKADDSLMVTAHLLHYVVRRARNMVNEWEKRDVVRQSFVRDLLDLIVTLSRGGERARPAMTLSVFALLHTSLAYEEVPRYGRIEPLVDAFGIAQRLASIEKGIFEINAQLLAAILGVLSKRVPRLPSEKQDVELAKLPGHLRCAFESAAEQDIREPPWIQGSQSIDPWWDLEKAKKARSE